MNCTSAQRLHKAVFFTLEKSMLLARRGGVDKSQAIIIFMIEEYRAKCIHRAQFQEQDKGLFLLHVIIKCHDTRE